MNTETKMNNDLTFPQWGPALGQRGEDLEHDDLMDADAYDRRRAIRDGWASDTEGRW
jgi:hypothetical protein